MLIQLLSDLHNEFLRNGRSHASHKWSGAIPETNADVIVLAGDIDTGTEGVEWAIAESNRLGKTILYVLGNHEFYRYEYHRLLAAVSELCVATNVQVLSEHCFEMDDVRFLGATLWTNYRVGTGTQDEAMFSASQGLTDHRLISYESASQCKEFTPLDALNIHKKELYWIESQCALPFDGKTVVITHHGPHTVCQHPGFLNNELSGAFHSDLDEFIEMNDINVWMFGHSHANLDVTINDTRIISNQAGYPGENVLGFDASLVIDV